MTLNNRLKYHNNNIIIGPAPAGLRAIQSITPWEEGVIFTLGSKVRAKVLNKGIIFRGGRTLFVGNN